MAKIKTGLKMPASSVTAVMPRFARKPGMAGGSVKAIQPAGPSDRPNVMRPTRSRKKSY